MYLTGNPAMTGGGDIRRKYLWPRKAGTHRQTRRLGKGCSSLGFPIMSDVCPSCREKLKAPAAPNDQAIDDYLSLSWG